MSQDVLLEGQVGPQIASDGSHNTPRMGRTSEWCVADAHARYQEAVSRGNVFTAASQAALTLGAGLSATSVWTLYNPIGSKVNLVLIDFVFAFSAPPAAAAVVFLAVPGTSGQAAPTGLTQLSTPWPNSLIGSNYANSAAKVYTAATLAAVPIVGRILGSVVAASSITPPTLRDEIAGALLIYPGGHVTLQASAAAAGFASMTWEEVNP